MLSIIRNLSNVIILELPAENKNDFLIFILVINKTNHKHTTKPYKMDFRGTITTFEMVKILQQNLPSGRVVLYEREEDKYIFIDYDDLHKYLSETDDEREAHQGLVEISKTKDDGPIYIDVGIYNIYRMK